MTTVKAIAHTGRIEERRALVSIIVPTFNEEAGIREMHKKLSEVLDGLPVRTEVLFVNDGSSDGTLAVLESIRASDARVGVLDLSRNYGKEVAMTAGLDHAR